MAALPQQVRAVIVQAAIVLAAVPAIMRSAEWSRTPRFAVPIAKGRSTAPPKFEEELLPRGSTPFVHAPSAAELPNGDLIAVWYGGTDEMQADVGIMSSRFDRETRSWSAPAFIETGISATAGIGAHVKSVGNPVVYATRDQVTLFFTAVVLGGWSGGTICVKQSTDGGTHWTPARRLYASPFFDIATLVKGRVVPYVDGSIALPYYHQLLRRWPGVLRIAPDGTVVDAIRIEAPWPLIQPWIVPTDFTHAIALMRWSSRIPGNVAMSRTDDAGRHWSAPERTAVMHRDSAVAAVRLSDGSLLAVYNNVPWDRRQLALVRSADDVHWSRLWPIESDHAPDAWFAREYSYPFMLQTSDGMIHVFYTWRRLRIAHLAFNESWVFQNAQLMGRR